MITFLSPKTWLLYLASAILGVGAAIIWTAQGSFLSRCSEESTISRNSGIFWALLQMRSVNDEDEVILSIDVNSHLVLCSVACSSAISLCSSNSRGKAISTKKRELSCFPL